MSKKLEGLFENPGLKIKNCAKIVFIIESLACLIASIIIGVNEFYELEVLAFILGCGGGGILVSFLMNLILYAIGELVENVSIIKDNTTHFQSNQEKVLEPKQTETKQVKPVSTPVQNTASNNKKECPNCGAKNNLSNSTCWACNHELE